MQRKFFLDTEFREGVTQRTFLGFKIGAPVPTIDLISLGCVCEDGRELYVLNSEHDLKASWHQQDAEGNYWLRENVLRPIYEENLSENLRHHLPFELKTMQAIFEDKGRTRRDIGYQLLIFTQPEAYEHWSGPMDSFYTSDFTDEPVFFTHYGDYDWVVAMQCFGTMMHKPKSFPFLAMDLQQLQLQLGMTNEVRNKLCPQPANEHNALADARWNKALWTVLDKRDRELAANMRSAYERGKLMQYGDLANLLRDATRGLKSIVTEFSAGFEERRIEGQLSMKLYVGQENRTFYDNYKTLGRSVEEGMKVNPGVSPDGFLQTQLLRDFIREAVARGIVGWNNTPPDNMRDQPMPRELTDKDRGSMLMPSSKFTRVV